MSDDLKYAIGKAWYAFILTPLLPVLFYMAKGFEQYALISLFSTLYLGIATYVFVYFYRNYKSYRSVGPIKVILYGDKVTEAFDLEEARDVYYQLSLFFIRARVPYHLIESAFLTVTLHVKPTPIIAAGREGVAAATYHDRKSTYIDFNQYSPEVLRYELGLYVLEVLYPNSTEHEKQKHMLELISRANNLPS